MIPGPETNEKLNAFKDWARAEVRRISMDWWGFEVAPGTTPEEAADYLDNIDESAAEMIKRQLPPCGAIGCIAGGVLIMAGLVRPHFDKGIGMVVYRMGADSMSEAANYLGISREDADALFFLPGMNRAGPHWPEDFVDRLGQVESGTPAYVEVVCDRIDFYQRTGE